MGDRSGSDVRVRHNQVNVRLTDDERDRIEASARAMGMTMQGYMRYKAMEEEGNE